MDNNDYTITTTSIDIIIPEIDEWITPYLIKYTILFLAY